MKKGTIITVAVIVVAAGAFFGLRPLLAGKQAVRYITRPVSYQDISASVQETGTINPVDQVSVGSEVSGTIKVLNVDFNSQVKKGQILATLDPTTFQAAVDSAAASLALAKANQQSAEVNVGKLKAQLDLANLTVQREELLIKKGLAAQSQMDTERTAAEAANQDYLASQSAVQVAQAQVAVAEGQLEQARFNLSRTIIKSPIDGVVMARNISIGQTVAASFQAPTLFVLASNLTDMQVDTSVDEADVGSVRPGEPAHITVTSYPNVIFSGTVEQVRVNPTVVQNVVTYDAVVKVHDNSGRLMPGMTAQIGIEVGKRTHVPSVPISAVLYRPLSPPSGGPGGIVAVGFQSNGTPPAAPIAGAPGSRATLWALRDGRAVPVQVVIGLSDGKNIEITGDALQEGDQVVIAQLRGGGGQRVASGGGGTAQQGRPSGGARGQGG